MCVACSILMDTFAESRMCTLSHTIYEMAGGWGDEIYVGGGGDFLKISDIMYHHVAPGI